MCVYIRLLYAYYLLCLFAVAAADADDAVVVALLPISSRRSTVGATATCVRCSELSLSLAPSYYGRRCALYRAQTFLDLTKLSFQYIWIIRLDAHTIAHTAVFQNNRWVIVYDLQQHIPGNRYYSSTGTLYVVYCTRSWLCMRLCIRVQRSSVLRVVLEVASIVGGWVGEVYIEPRTRRGSYKMYQRYLVDAYTPCGIRLS